MAYLLRRDFLQSSLLAASALAARPALSQERRKISFVLPFLAEGNNAYTFIARAKGYWDELGLDVQISRGAGSVASAQAIGAGKFQFGLAVPTAAIQQAAKGLNLVAIASAGYDATMGICLLESSPIRSAKELKGKRLATVVSSGEHPFLPVFAQRAGFDIKDVELVQTDPNVRQRLLLSGQVDALSGFAGSFIPPLVSQGHAAHALLYSEYGMTLYNNALLTQPEMVAKEPKLCADITSGLVKGIKYILLEPDDSLKLFLKEVPEAGLTPASIEQVRLGMGIFANTVLYEAAMKNSLGYAAPADYAGMIDLVMKYVASPGDKAPKVSDVMSNDFIGKLVLTPDEWKKATANAAPFRKYLTTKVS
jgi:NitT/TauT family transport system substrate-binding protein